MNFIFEFVFDFCAVMYNDILVSISLRRFKGEHAKRTLDFERMVDGRFRLFCNVAKAYCVELSLVRNNHESLFMLQPGVLFV